MKHVKINLKNCYGIRLLNQEFIFSDKKAYVIYAQNGVMKSSLARTFKDFSEDKQSIDRIYKNRETVREILDENNNPIDKESIFVIVPYNKTFKSEKMSYLLANKDLKQEYDDLHREINEKKDILIELLKKSSGLKSNIEEIFSETMTHDAKDFFKSIMRVEYEVETEDLSQLGKIHYPTIFNDKVIALLKEDDFRTSIKEYIEIYDKLIDGSTFFKKGIFNHNNAEDIAKNLDSNGFFRANHTVNISVQGKKHEIGNINELKSAIQTEKDIILNNKQLSSSFESIDKKLIKNAELRKFRDYIDDNRFILLELNNIEKFSQSIWVAYLAENKDAYIDLVSNYKIARKRIEEIVAKARREKTKWIDVIDIFNKRFSVPFIVNVANQDDVILKRDVPNIIFQFTDGGNEVAENVNESQLLDTLSNGELRALYILNIIFEVEARKEAKQKTLFIIDDIADSFDYKNKYAIAEYLKDISEADLFFQIILTHNFDFYRTMSSRLDTGRKNRMHAIKTNDGIILKEETYQKNPLLTWKDKLGNPEYFISLIPFMRNLAEYSGLDKEFGQLTSLLHIKSDTKNLNICHVCEIMKKIFSNIDDSSILNKSDNVLNMIYSTAKSIADNQNNDLELESKVVLSIAIRLKAEEFMISKINDDTFVKTIISNQTFKLTDRFKSMYPTDKNLPLIAEVNLMTPENIHLNSFMYEPILDMACDNLKRLFKDVSAMGLP